MKNSKILVCMFTSALLSISALAFSNLNTDKIAIGVRAEETEELDLTTLSFSNTPSAGWGGVNVNKTCDGQDIVVNGVTYQTGFGTHVFDDKTSTAGDMEFDISSLSSQYEYFEAKVAQPTGGNNCIRFAVLVDGVEKDYVVWRVGFGDGNPYIVRCSIKGGHTLTLRTQCTEWGYSSGTSVWINPRLYNVTGDKVYASDILDRVGKTNTTGWGAYVGGDYTYGYSLYDQRVNGQQFSAYTPYGDPCQYTKGIGTQLRDGNYDIYAANKTDLAHYMSFKFDIKDKGYSLFNTVASMFAGGGCYIDAWIDGEEVYHHPDVVSASNAGEIINIAIPSDAEEFELRVIAANGMGDGLVDLLGAAFYKGSEYLYSYCASEVMAPEYRWPVTRNVANNGRALMIRDSVSSTNIPTEKGMMIHQNGSYTFDATGIEYDTLSGKIGAVAEEENHLTNRLVATFTYGDGTQLVKESNEFSYANSNIDFTFKFHPENLQTIKLELSGDLAFSRSVINGAKFSNTGVGNEHVDNNDWQKDENGHYHVCEICGEHFDDAIHEFGDWVILTPATIYEKGLKERTCSVCGYKETEELDVIIPTETGIQIVNAPTKLTYKYNEELDLTGLRVVATMSDEAPEKLLNENEYTVTGYSKTTLGAQTLTVTYKEFAETFTVTVEDYETGINLISAPTKVEYEVGDEFDVSGLSVEVTMASGITQSVETNELTLVGFDSTNAGQVTITVTYKEFTLTFNVTVKEKAVDPDEPTKPEEPEKKGCKGSVIASSIIVSTIALTGAILVGNKKKED